MRRALATVAKGLALVVVFFLAAAGSLVLHLDLPASRRAVAAYVSQILDRTIKGKVIILRIGGLRLSGIDGVDAELCDPEGQRVLHVQGLHARIEPLPLLRSLARRTALVVRIPELGADGAEVVLERDRAGELGLQRALEPRVPRAPGGRPVEVIVSRLRLRHGWVHGGLSIVPVIDVDLEDLAGAFASTRETTAIEVEHLVVRGRGLLGANPEGTVEARAVLPSDPSEARTVSAHYEGRVGEAQVRAEVSGQLPVLHPHVRARIGAGELDASGTVTLPEGARSELVASMRMDTRDLDLSLLRDGAPPSRLTAALEAWVVARPGGLLSGDFHLESQEGRAGGHLIPRASLRGAFTDRSIRGVGEVFVRGAPTRIRFALRPRGGEASPSELAVEGETTIPDLHAVPRLPVAGHGKVHLLFSGHMDLRTKRISARAEGEASGLDFRGVQLDRGSFTVAAQGPLESPRLSARFHGAGVRAAGYAFTRGAATASGTLREMDVTAELTGEAPSPSIVASAHVTTGQGLAVRGARLDLARPGVTGRASVASVRVAGGTIDVRGMTIEGLGAPIEGSFDWRADTLTVRARGADVDLARVTGLIMPGEHVRGHLALDLDLRATTRGALGHVDAEVRDLAVGEVRGATLRLSAVMDGAHLNGDALVSLGDAGHLLLSASDFALAGSVTEPSAWKTVTGTVALRGTVDLARLLAQLPANLRPVEEASGILTIRGEGSRGSPSASPALELEAETSGLSLVARRARVRNADGSIAILPAPWHTSGIDGSVAAKLDGSTGQAQLSSELHDARGVLASLDASAGLPIAAILRSPGRTLALVVDAPVEARVSIPRRSLDTLPPLLGTPPVEGDVELVGELHGTARAPYLHVTARGTNLLPRSNHSCVDRLNVEASLGYDGEQADVRASASREGREIAGADATVRVSAVQAMIGGAITWEASGDVALSDFPLAVAGAFLHQPVAGELSGEIALHDLHRAASLAADLDLRDLALDHAVFPHGEAHVAMKEGTLSASARLEGADGFGAARVTGATSWGAALLPAVDSAKPLDVAIDAKSFPADAVTPLLRGAVSELAGRIDAHVRLRVEPGGEDGHMEGAVTLRDGALEVPLVNQRFRAIQARVIMKPWGTLRFEDVSAEAPTGRLTGKADIVLAGLALRSADAEVHVARGESIPIALEGMPLGRVHGDVRLRAQMSQDGKRLDAHVDVPTLHLELPPAPAHPVQPLDPDETIHIGVTANREFVAVPLGPPPKSRASSALAVRVVIDLGGDVEVKRDNVIDLVLEGRPVVEITDQMRVAGEVRVARGTLDIQGKQFTIDRAVLSFTGGGPEDPLVVATASWEASDGTQVHADFSGHLKRGRLDLRATPPLSQSEILALLLFGSPEAGPGAETPELLRSITAGVAGLAGGLVTEALNKAISGITTARVSTRLDTSEAGNLSQEISVQLSKSLSVRIRYRLGVPAPGQSPDRAELSLDWRLFRNWSLTAVVGDQGSTSLDVEWRLRY